MERITTKDGAVEQSNFYDYLIPRMSDVPLMHIEVISTDNPPTGVGQMATPLVTPAIGNAIAQLTGTRLRHAPFTPARVKKALAQRVRDPRTAGRAENARPAGWGGLQYPSHGENRGSSPLGSANRIK